jgi:hypothetical protein
MVMEFIETISWACAVVFCENIIVWRNKSKRCKATYQELTKILKEPL